ncbi:hypothetical protein O181_001664 [Austropuccinia psidii MF-1]|uniref:Uncharacterized protein n=1 Tax=Austropuccinia psidii MF-1 TaxID=1389203 RepID=A0A9Q3GC35_9BASI|nr:hypothetical protein [Austropuccinia psidii MF-1]
MAHLWWNVTVHLAWLLALLFTQLLALVKDPNASHANPHACKGYQIFKLLTPGKPPDNSNTSLCQCRLPMLQGQILMLVQVPDNANNSLRWGRLPMLQTQIFTLVQAPSLTLVQVPNNSDNSLHWASQPKILNIPYMTKINSV